MKAKKPETELGKSAAQALKRAAKRARQTAQRYGTPILVQSDGKVVALRP